MTTTVYPRWPGDTTPPFIQNLCRDLQSAGCDITVLAPHSKGSARREKGSGIEIVRYPYLWPAALQTLCYEGGMNVRLREHPLRLLQLPFLALAQLRIIRSLLRQPFDLIHAHSLLPQGWLAALANSGRLPLVTSSHGADVYQLKRRWRPLLMKAVSASDALIANSSSTQQRLRELGAPDSRIHVIPATPNYPDPETRTHGPGDRPVLLYAGRWISEKGVDLLVEAMPTVLEKIPDVMLRIAGAGSLETHLRQRVHELGLQSRVALIGWKEAGELREEMRKASLLVAPSRVIEGQNLVVTEALSVGCPVATTPRGGVLDLVTDRETGFIIQDAQVGLLAEAIVAALSDTELLGNVSTKGFERFQSRFSRNRITRQTLDLYRLLLEEHGRDGK